MYKIVFFDVDGTLTDHRDGSISISTKRSVRTLINNGVQVVAATGRPLSMCTELIELGIQTFITANGAYVKYKDEVIHKNVLDQDVLIDVIHYAKTNDSGLSFFTESLSMNGVRNTKIKSALLETLLLNDYPVTDEQIHLKEIYLLCLYADHKTVQHYESRFPELTFSRWHPYICNVLQEEVDKSIAVKKVLTFFDLDESEAIAFGDGYNDMQMLEMAGLGIAMGNGNEQLKSIANFVTRNSSDDGIEYALRKYGVI